MKTIAELKAANLPHAQGAEMIKITPAAGVAEDDAEYLKDRTEILAVLDPYFAQFLPHAKNCVRCDAVLFGGLLEGSTFTWGLAHGEGVCGECGYPVRMYHFIKDDKGEGFATLRGVGLQYHPDLLEEKPNGPV